jgi:hypothetical protein
MLLDLVALEAESSSDEIISVSSLVDELEAFFVTSHQFFVSFSSDVPLTSSLWSLVFPTLILAFVS